MKLILDMQKVTTKKRARRSRQERSEETRTKLFRAGAVTVGRYGYENASIAKITIRAQVALGTFYRHFESRQQFFQELVPAMADELLKFIQQRVERDATGAEREVQRLNAYFEFLEAYPWFHRLLNESEAWVPKAYEDYFGRLTSGLVRSLRRSRGRAELAAFEEAELLTLAHVVMASREYLAKQYMRVPRDKAIREREHPQDVPKAGSASFFR